jgi:hypothetical protein
MHKTGSTSIQVSLQGYADEKFLYADLGRVSNHSLAIYSLFAAHPERHHLHRAGQRSVAQVHAFNEAMRADLERAVAAAGERTLLISGEDISVLPPADLARLREYFRRFSDKLAIVGYVRPPAAFMTSGFQQRVKGGSVERVSLEREYRNYRKTFEKFDEVFGRENVALWKFDPASFPGGCAVRDFCSRLGIPLPAERITRLNESLSREAVSLLYTYCKLARGQGAPALRAPEGQRIGELIARDIGNQKFRFSPEVTRPILEKNRGDIEWMEARLGASLHEELGEHRPGDVRGEEDLLDPGPDALGKLLALLGDAAPDGLRGKTPQEIASLVAELREMGGAIAGSRAQYTTAELIADMRHRAPDLWSGIPAERAETLVNSVFQHINDTLGGTESGRVDYPGLGHFQVRPAAGAAKGRRSKTRILFRGAGSGRGGSAESRYRVRAKRTRWEG